MSFKEHNNRKKAKKLAEYITGEELRKYLASKVEKYIGTSSISVFDGAAGSGQLLQYLNIHDVCAVEIQQDSCEALLTNFPFAKVTNDSFFNYQSTCVCDVAVMNPPFSIKFKDLTEEEQNNIKNEFDWKKNGVVDDIFVLKALKHTRRFGFFIMFPGVAYRGTEKKFREILGNHVTELNVLEDAFDDTAIKVIFLIVDKEKTNNTATRELYNCKTKQIINSDEWEISPESWEMIQEPPSPTPVFNPIEEELKARELIKRNLIKNLNFSKQVAMWENMQESYNNFCDDLSHIVLKARL